MNDSLIILGRQPALGIAELESLYGPDAVRPISNNAMRVRSSVTASGFARLGGAIKLCKIIDTIDSTNWSDVSKYLQQTMPKLAAEQSEGKLTLGLSVYGIRVSLQQIMTTGLVIKKALRVSANRSVRLVPNQEQALNSAQVIHNHLTKPSGIELVLIRDRNTIICARTTNVQDINAYTLRDRGRPKRDARVGMLPPKLAQSIINLASTSTQQGRVLDPFCGTGVILQEAVLMGYDVYGTDLEPRMVEYTTANLDWLAEKLHVAPRATLEIGDATDHTWSPPIDFVAGETYLGQAFNTYPGNDKIEQVRGICNLILERFLTNLHGQIPSGCRLCLAVPAWQQKSNQFLHLPLLDHLNKLGYNRLSFEHARTEDLVYYREGQIVGRELLVITRK